MKWPTVEDATRRINILIGDQAETDMAARDLIVLMRELGRVTAEVNHLKYERQEIIDNALEEQAALRCAAPPASGALPRQPTEAMLNAARDWSIKKYGQGIGNDGAIGCWQAMYAAALAAEPASGEAKERRIDKRELDRANAAIQRAAMAMGSTDEWADQEAMIGDFEERFSAMNCSRCKAPGMCICDSSLAAEPASGEATWHDGCLHPNSCANHGQCMYVGCVHQGKPIAHAATQGEEETARSIVRHHVNRQYRAKQPPFPPAFYADELVEEIAAALRQHADEATRAEREACARMSDRAASNARYLGYEDAAIEFENLAAERARIAPKGQL